MVDQLRCQVAVSEGQWSEAVRWGRAVLQQVAPALHPVDLCRVHRYVAEALLELDRSEEAREHAGQTMEFARLAAEQPAAPIAVIAAYARLLLDPPMPELRDPDRALVVAEWACRLSHGVHPGAVRTLADAQVACNRPQAAMATLSSAVGGLTPGSPLHGRLERQRRSIERSLAGIE